MAENQRNRVSEERMRSERNDESLNTSSQSEQRNREGMEQGSGRSYDHGKEEQQQQPGRRNISSDDQGSSNMGNRSDHARESGSGMGQGSGLNTKRSVTGSDYDGQNSE